MEFNLNLRDYQQAAVDKLLKIRVNALFMDMGTGKTRTMLEIINKRLEKGKINHVIWLCPCSVKENLRRDIIYHTGSEQKDLITICGIETLSTSIKWLKYLTEIAVKYNCQLVVDESSKIKNFLAKRTKNTIYLAEYCKYKAILNGTPVTRREDDLFAQMYFLDWRILGYKSLWSFNRNHVEYDEYNRPRRCLNVDYLIEKIAPYAYQIKKEECLELPPKSYKTMYFALDEKQDNHYEYVKDLFLDKVDEFDQTTIYRLLTALQLVLSGYKVKPTKKIKTVKKFNFQTGKMENTEIEVVDSIEKELVRKTEKDNPRLALLMNIITDLEGKCIIFCKYTEEIDMILDLLKEKGYTAVRFDGKVSLKQRDKNIEEFRTNAQFLVANKVCGAFGLNLQFCAYAIFYTNDFDYGTRSQAEDRIYRLGQTKNVHIIDICASNKLDERILSSLARKENLADSIMKEMEENGNAKEALVSTLSVQNRYTNKREYKYVKALDKSDLLEDIGI